MQKRAEEHPVWQEAMQQGPVIKAQERKKKEQEARRNREKARNTKDPRPDQEDPRSVQRLGLDCNHCFPLSKQMAPDPSEFIALNNPHWRQWYILYYMYNYVYILTYSIIFTKSQCLTRVDLIFFLQHVAMAMLWPCYGHVRSRRRVAAMLEQGRDWGQVSQG